MENPYESPTISPESSSRDWFPVSISRFTSHYFYAIAGLGIVTMILGLAGFGQQRLDLSFLFAIWAGRGLSARSNTARLWVIGFCGLFVAATTAIAATSLIRGTEGMSVRFFWRFENPTPSIALIVAGAMLIVVMIPLVLLLSAQARREFAGSNTPK